MRLGLLNKFLTFMDMTHIWFNKLHLKCEKKETRFTSALKYEITFYSAQ